MSRPFEPKKSLGQNFLRDPNIARKIARSLEAPESARVIEIGGGTGALTEVLVDHYPNLTVIEIDDRAVQVLREEFPDLEIRAGDVLEVDWHAWADRYQAPLYVIGNLPYNITSPTLFSLLDAIPPVERIVVTLQREVAERIAASSGSKAYGILSVLLQLKTTAEVLFTIPPHVFSPQPRVSSAVLRLDRRTDDLVDAVREVGFERIRRVVRTAFNQRRKMMRNSLSPVISETGRELPEPWDSRRPEALSPREFVQLTRYLFTGVAPESA